MKTKNIFKTLAAAMLMPAMLLNTACNKEIETENTAGKGYTLPVTVNVTRQADDPASKATYNESTRKLEFSTGDKLFVQGNHYTAGDFAGTLDYDTATGKFRGTITTENPYSGTADAFFSSAAIKATLLPAGYESYGYLFIDDNGTGDVLYDDYIDFDDNKAIAESKAAGVAQFSLEQTWEYDDGITLEPQNAILNFTITGLTASTEVDVKFGNGSVTISGSVATDGDGTATFAIGVIDDTDLNSFVLTVGGNAITLVSESKRLAAGKIYNINRPAAPAAPEGAIGGVFSVSATIKVYFAKGNLTYNSGTWSFLENSWTYNPSPSLYNKTDGSQHFNWETIFSGDDAVQTDITTDLGAGWRGLSDAEWEYLLGLSSAKRTVQWHYYAKIKGAGIGAGDKRYLLIFPDNFKETDWTEAMGTKPTSAFDGTSEQSIAYTEANFTAIQAAGIVILPAAGYRTSSWVGVGGYGNYWSSTTYEIDTKGSYDSSYAKHLRFHISNVYMDFNDSSSSFSVRLVQNL